MLKIQWYFLLLVVAAGLVLGWRIEHERTARVQGTDNGVVSGSSMSPTLNSGDNLRIRKVGSTEILRNDWIVEFSYLRDKNIKRLKAQEGQIWEGKIVPQGFVAIAGDNKYCTDPNLPVFIPRKWITGVVVAVEYSECFISPEGKKEPATQHIQPVVPAEQPLRTINGIRIVRVDKNSSTLTDIGMSGDLRPYYRAGMTVVEESTAKAFVITDVGYAPEGGLTRLATTPQFGSWTNDGRVALLDHGQNPPKDIVGLFRKLP